jgi:hypothetical protein
LKSLLSCALFALDSRDKSRIDYSGDNTVVN